eukprot:Em0221g6a
MSAAAKNSREKILQPVIETASKASSLESWGMPVEATAEYMRCNRQLTIATTVKESFTDSEKEFLLRIARVMEMRANALQESRESEAGSASIDVTDICKALQNMILGDMTPVETSVYNRLPVAPAESRIVQKPRSLFLSDDDYSRQSKPWEKVVHW